MANAELPYRCAWYSSGGDSCIQSEIVKGPEVWTCIYNNGVPGYCRYCNSTISAYDYNGRMYSIGIIHEVNLFTACVFNVNYYCTSTGNIVHQSAGGAMPPINPDLCPSCETINSDQDGFSSCFDCNDWDASINPFAPELCDGKDNNCDGVIDDTCLGEDNQCNELPNSTITGSSANFASGNLYHSQTILHTPNSGLPALFTISYNSLDATSGSFGRGWTHNYNLQIVDSGSTLALAEADGRRVYYRSSVGGNTYYPDSSSGRHSIITRNTNGSYLLTEKTGTKYSFDYTGRLANITDKNNNTLNLSYTGSDLMSITDSAGRITTFTYDSSHRITSITDSAGRRTAFTYTSDFLTAVTDPLGSTWTYTYDGRMLAKTDPLGHITSYAYDATGKIISSLDAEGNMKTITYDQTNQAAYVTEKNGTNWTYVYDNSLNAPLQTTDPSANQTTYQYDSGRNLISKTEPDGRTTSYTYDTNGNMLSKTDALGNTTSFTYDSYGQILTSTDPDGNTTAYIYDANGNLIQETDAQGNSTSYTYSTKGEKLSETDPKGNINTYAYNSYGNLSSAANALNQTTTYTYDISGNMLSMTDANGAVTTYEYDLADRLTKETKPDNGIINYEYDLAGNRTALTDANGNRTIFIYDNLNRLIRTTDPEGNSINYAYDSEGNTTSMIIKDSSNNIITYENYTYDGNHRLTNLLTKNSQLQNLNSFSYTRDSSGNITAITDNLHFTKNKSYNYDSLYRLTSASGQWGAINFIYDSVGNRQVQQINTETTNYSYNADKLISYTSSALTSAFSYDNSGNITAENNRQYIYNQNQRLIKVADTGTVLGEYTYNGTGLRVKKTVNGIAAIFHYDQNGLLIAESTNAGVITDEYVYLGGQPLAKISKTVSGAGYNYPVPLFRASLAFNINSSSLATGWLKYYYTRNRLSLNSTSITGLLISGGTATVTGAGTVNGASGYTFTATITDGTPDAIGIEIYKPDGTPYFNAVSKTIASGNYNIEDSNIYYYHNDHLGTPVMITDENQNTVWEGEFMPFGEPVSITGSIINNLRFPGQYYDAETGMHQNWYRDYKPEIGRYVEFDPILQPKVSKTIKSSCAKSTVTWRVPLLISNQQDLYHYVYTADNPINRTDPTGLVWYGNWCGPGGSGNPRNCYDSACKKHDNCYDNCSIDALSRWSPGSILGECAKACDKTLLSNWKKCACSRSANGRW